MSQPYHTVVQKQTACWDEEREVACWGSGISDLGSALENAVLSILQKLEQGREAELLDTQ